MKIKTFLLLIFPIYFFSQNRDLQQLREIYCKNNCKKYQAEQNWIKQDNPPPPPQKGIYPKLKRIFNIPFTERMKVYPFSEFDSIYVASPNYVIEKEEKRNYLDKKYHHSIRQISLSERDKLSDILFNYYELNSFGAKTGLFNAEDEDYCIQSRYPKIILLFMKNGNFEKYVAFPDEGFNRYNFSDEDYFQNFDWSYEKEGMILKLFKQDILPEEKCKK